jgi:hypothetical protein
MYSSMEDETTMSNSPADVSNFQEVLHMFFRAEMHFLFCDRDLWGVFLCVYCIHNGELRAVLENKI